MLPEISSASTGKTHASSQQLFFITCSKSNPLSWFQRLAWSYLLKQHKAGKSGTQSELAQLSGHHRDRCRSAFQKLIDLGIAERTNYRAYIPKQPAEEKTDWFVPRKSKSKNWFDQFAYFPINLSAGLALDAVLLGLIRSLAGKSGSAQNQSCAGLSGMVGCDWTTAKVALERLEKQHAIELITVRKTRYGNPERFDILLKMTSDATNQKPEAVSMPIESKNDLAQKPDPSDREFCLQLLERNKIPHGLAQDIIHLVFNKMGGVNPIGIVLGNLDTAKQKHDGNYPHPGYLMRKMIEDIVNKRRHQQRQRAKRDLEMEQTIVSV